MNICSLLEWFVQIVLKSKHDEKVSCIAFVYRNVYRNTNNGLAIKPLQSDH